MIGKPKYVLLIFL